MKKLLIVLLVLVAVVAGGGMLVDPDRHIERSIVIAAEPAEIHPYIDDLAAWRRWSAWDEDDDTIVYTYEGPSSGVGAKVSWTSENSGIGEQVIVESDPERGVWCDMIFEGDMPAKVGFAYERVDGGTRVVWQDDFSMGDNPVWRWMGLFLDGMVGPYFERGLANLKTLVEGDQA